MQRASEQKSKWWLLQSDLQHRKLRPQLTLPIHTFPEQKAVKKRGAVSSLRLGYLRSSDDYKPSFSGSERAEEEATRSKRLGADRLASPIPLCLRTLGKATRYWLPVNGPGGRAAAARNLAEMCRSERQTRQRGGSAAPRLHRPPSGAADERRRKRYVTARGGRRL